MSEITTSSTFSDAMGACVLNFCCKARDKDMFLKYIMNYYKNKTELFEM